jgi:hypothetical protein
MDLVLRAYDSATVARAEAMPVEQLLTALRRGALRATDKRRAGLDADEDVYARETIAERLEGFIQENLGERSLASLSAEPTEGPAPIPLHGAAIDADEAIALREDLVRTLTYGLWRAPEEVVSHILGVVGHTDSTRLLGDPTAFAELQSVLDIAQDDEAFTARFGEAIRASLARAKRPTDQAAVRRELAAFGQVLGPIARLLHGAQAVGLRVIVYQDEPGADGLTHFLAQDRPESPAEPLPIPRMSANGHGGPG